jgi:F-type H+-transporting ATPase subunit delta
MKVTPIQYARALYEATKDQSVDEISASVKRLVDILAKRQEIKKLPAIIAAFERLWESEKNEWQAELTSATPFTAEAKELLREYWGHRTGRINGRLEFTEKQDPELLGGFLLKAGGRLWDASLRRAVSELKIRLSA